MKVYSSWTVQNRKTSEKTLKEAFDKAKMKQMMVFSLSVIFFNLLCRGSTFELDDAFALTCSEQRNVTILIGQFGVKFFRKWYGKFINVFLKPLVQKESCFIINIFDWKEDRVLQLRENTNLNHIVRNFHYDRTSFEDTVYYQRS